MKEALEEGRRWKKGRERGIRGGIDLDFGGKKKGEQSRENFYRRIESKKGWNREGRKLKERVNSRGKIYTQRRGKLLSGLSVHRLEG